MNLDIEGTKHEKVVIIVLSYVIGFTAGFICFGVAQSMRAGNVGEGTSEPAVAAVVSETPVAPATSETPAVASTETPRRAVATNFDVTYTDGKLQVINGEDIYLLSMKSSGLDSAVQSAFKNQGMHFDIPAYITSPDNKFVYFCEQQAATDTCNSFIFDVTKNVIEYVTVDGTKLVTTGAVAKTATWSDRGLTLDGNTSAAATAPAVLLVN